MASGGSRRCRDAATASLVRAKRGTNFPKSRRQSHTQHHTATPWQMATRQRDRWSRNGASLRSFPANSSTPSAPVSTWRTCDITAAYRHCVTETCSRHHGTVGKHMGNTVVVYFGYPAAHEHVAEQAVRAALDLCAALQRLPAPRSLALQCRVGIATGLAIAGQDAAPDGAIVGEAPTVASHLQASAKPGTVVIDKTTRLLIGDLFDCRAVDTEAAIASGQAWEVLRASALDNRFEALRGARVKRLVGRQEELDVLQRRWAEARIVEGRVVLIAGEPGIGKSRLAQALQELAQAEPHIRLRFFSSPHHATSALYPVTRELERILQDCPCDRNLERALRSAQRPARPSTRDEPTEAQGNDLYRASGTDRGPGVAAAPIDDLRRRSLDGPRDAGTSHADRRARTLAAAARDRDVPSGIRTALGRTSARHDDRAQPVGREARRTTGAASRRRCTACS